MRIEVCSKAVSRLVGKIGEELFNKWLLVREADVLAQAPEYERQRLDKIANLRCIKERLKTGAQADEQSKLKSSGSDLLGIGYEPTATASGNGTEGCQPQSTRYTFRAK